MLCFKFTCYVVDLASSLSARTSCFCILLSCSAQTGFAHVPSYAYMLVRTFAHVRDAFCHARHAFCHVRHAFCYVRHAFRQQTPALFFFVFFRAPQTCNFLAREVSMLQAQTGPALEDLIRSADRDNLERVRRIKTAHQRFLGRVKAVRESLQRLVGGWGSQDNS